MSRLEELIQQYCPDGVEYKPLAECCNILDGKRKPITKGARQSGSYPYYGANGIQDWVADYIFDGTYVLIGEDGSVITPNGTPIVNWAQGKIWVNNHAHIIAEKTGVLLRFLFYFIQTIDIHNLVHGNIPKLTQSDLKELEIPVPPLPVQEEIVRILDAFTELQAELQAELQKRKQQYNYYLDNLLSFNSEGQAEVRWMKLKDVATQWYRGAGIKREEVSEDGMPCIRYGEIHTTYNIWFDDCISHTDESKQVSRKYAEKGDILFAITSEDIPFVGNSVAYLGDERILVGGDIVVMKHNQDPKYMAYALSTSDAIKQKGKGKVKSKVVHTNVPSLQEIVIPIPSMTEQKRIASILDRFDTLTNDLTSGLPAEIEKRRQQYEYYRDKLLTFKRKEA